MTASESPAAKRERLRKQLDDTHTWPCSFRFKFIVPNEGDGETQLKLIFSKDAAFQKRPSRNGKYVAWTIEDRVGSAEDVFRFYEAASTIPGVISL
jgi:hypothetical protein